MKTIRHNLVNNLFESLLGKIPQTDSGTYNSADPTAYRRGSVDLSYHNQHFQIQYYDCTWGIEFRVLRREERAEKLIGKFFFAEERVQNSAGEWHYRSFVNYFMKNSGVLKLLARLEKMIPEIEEEEYYPEPELNPGGGSYYIES